MRRTSHPWCPSLFGVVAVLLATVSPGVSLAPAGAADRPLGDPHPHPEGVTSEFRYGPITLAPAVGDQPGRFAAAVPFTPALCSNCYLTGVRVDLVYQDGSSANLDSGVMLHHLVVFNSGRPDATCPPNTPLGSFGERFFASGNERTGGALPPGFGYHLGTDPVRTVVDLMNHSHEPKVVSIKATSPTSPTPRRTWRR
jgi:hypothetical protein